MAAADALNYPYIRVRDVDWLKRTLLVFPHVVRMTPGFARGAPADDEWIAPFTYPRNDEEALSSGRRGWIFHMFPNVNSNCERNSSRVLQPTLRRSVPGSARTPQGWMRAAASGSRLLGSDA
jgi:hypothetical protein